MDSENKEALDGDCPWQGAQSIRILTNDKLRRLWDDSQLYETDGGVGGLPIVKSVECENPFKTKKVF